MSVGTSFGRLKYYGTAAERAAFTPLFVWTEWLETDTSAIYVWDGSSWITSVPPGGPISGSGVAGQVAVWDGVSSIAGYTSFTHDGVTGATYMGGTLNQAVSDAATNTTTTVQTIDHNTSGAPAAGYGTRTLYRLESSTTPDQQSGAFDVYWTDPTHATRTSALRWSNVINGFETPLLTLTTAGSVTFGTFTVAFPASGTAAMGAGTLTVSTTNNVAGATHTHAITSSSNPGVAASILASDVSGFLQLTGLGIGTAPTTLIPINEVNNFTTAGASETHIGYNYSSFANVGHSGTNSYGMAFVLRQIGGAVGISNIIGISSLVVNQTAVTAGNVSGGSFTASVTSGGGASNLDGITATGAAAGAVATSVRGAKFFAQRSATVSGSAYAVVGIAEAQSTGVIGNGAAFYALSATKAGGATFTAAYGLYVEAQTVAGTNYAIYTNAGAVRFGDTITQTVTSALTNTTQTNVTLGHNTSGTPAAGFGTRELVQLESSTTADQSATSIIHRWADATHATRAGELVFGAYYTTTEREAMKFTATSTGSYATFGGGVRVAVVTKAADYTATTSDFAIIFTATATLSLPAATGSGQTYHIYNEGTAGVVVTIDPNGSDTLKGELTQTLNPGDDLIIRDYAAAKWA